MPKWRFLIDHLSGPQNMKRDLSFFLDFESQKIPSALCLYTWTRPCISLGYSQKIEEEIDVEKAKDLGWDVVARPTGGGIVFHNEAEVTYSLVTSINNPIFPKGLMPSYKKISEAVVYALRELGIKAEILNPKSKTLNNLRNRKSKLKKNLCFSYPAEYEIVVGQKKIVGSAQKRGKRTLLQQGSIFVRKTDDPVFSVLRKPHEGINAVSIEEILKRKVGFDELSGALMFGFEKGLNIQL